MKELTDSGRYAEALHLVGHPSQVSNDIQNPFIQASLIHFYMQCKDVDRAEQIFFMVDRKSPGISGAMMKGYVSNGMPSKALDLFERTSMKPNEITLLILFNACAKVANAQAKKIGRDLLGQLADQRLDDEKLINSALDMLMKFGDVEHAERLFNGMKKRSIVTYGAMMQGYVINDLSEKALDRYATIGLFDWRRNLFVRCRKSFSMRSF
jgi:pentatricopeptide repeat protein